jgi:histone H4
MRFRGKGGLGKGGKKAITSNRTYNPVLSNAAMRVMGKRGACKRFAKSLYSAYRDFISNVLQQLITDAAVYTTHAKRKTITTVDFAHAIRHNNLMLYGADDKARWK